MALPAQLSPGLALKGIGVVCAAYLIKGVVMLYQKRMWFRQVAKEHDLKTLPNHSFLFGDLINMGKAVMDYPADVSHQNTAYMLCQKFPEAAATGVIYVDLWPISWPMMFVLHPDMCAQFTQERSLGKHVVVRHQFNALSENKDLVTSDGAFWKKWRAIYNPGFSSQNIQRLVPSFMEEALVWKSYLRSVAASGETICFETQAMKAACDIIACAVLGKGLGCQADRSRLVVALKKNIAWIYTAWEPPGWGKMLNPLRPLAVWYNNRIIYNELRPIIEEQLRQGDRSEGPKAINTLDIRTAWEPLGWGNMLNPLRPLAVWYNNWMIHNELKPIMKDQLRQGSRSEGPKTINALAIRAYYNNKVANTGGSGSSKFDQTEFINTAIQQMKIFLFAGHDTTSSALCYVFSRLHQNPDALARLRAEHDAILGPDPEAAAALISATPTLLNQLPYTTAVLKESLRLSSPIASVRESPPGFYLVHPETRRRFPTHGFMIMSCSDMIHRAPEYWPRPEEFLPERFLVPDGHPLHPRRNAYRPFELGARACIGQEMVMTELRMILAITARDLEITVAYDAAAPTFNGDHAYQAKVKGELIPHPKDGLPVKVRLRKHVPAGDSAVRRR